MGSNSSSASDDGIAEQAQDGRIQMTDINSIISEKFASQVSELAKLPVKQALALPIYKEIATAIRCVTTRENTMNYQEIQSSLLDPIQNVITHRINEYNPYVEVINQIISEIPINTDVVRSFFAKKEAPYPTYKLPQNVTSESFKNAMESKEPELLILLLNKHPIKDKQLMDEVLSYLSKLSIETNDISFQLESFALLCSKLTNDPFKLEMSKVNALECPNFSTPSIPLSSFENESQATKTMANALLVGRSILERCNNVLSAIFTGKETQSTGLARHKDSVMMTALRVMNSPSLGVVKDMAFAVAIRCVAVSSICGLIQMDQMLCHDFVSTIEKNFDSFDVLTLESLSAFMSFAPTNMLADSRFAQLYKNEKLASHLRGPMRFLMKPQASFNAIDAFDFLINHADDPLIPLAKTIIDSNDQDLQVRFVISLLFMKPRPRLSRYILESDFMLKFLSSNEINGFSEANPEVFHKYFSIKPGPDMFSWIVHFKSKTGKIVFTPNFSQNTDAVLITNDEMYEVKKGLSVSVQTGSRISINLQGRDKGVKFNIDAEEVAQPAPPIDQKVLLSTIVARTFSNLLACCIFSLGISTSEAENHIFIESELTKLYSAVARKSSTDHISTKKAIRMVSADARDFMANSFITQLSTDKANDNIVHYLQMMEAKIKFRGKIPAGYQKIEKVVLAAIAQRLDVAQDFVAHSINALKEGKVSSVPQSISSIWKFLHKGRQLVMMQKQHCTSTGTNFQLYLDEIYRKAMFLLGTTPLSLNGTLQEKIKELADFIFSTVKMSEVRHIIDEQDERLEIRTTALNTLIKILKSRCSDFTLTNIIIQVGDTSAFYDSRSTAIGNLQKRANLQKTAKQFISTFASLINSECKALLFLFFAYSFPNNQEGLMKCLRYDDQVIKDCTYRCMCSSILSSNIDIIKASNRFCEQGDPFFCLIHALCGIRATNVKLLLKIQSEESIILASGYASDGLISDNNLERIITKYLEDIGKEILLPITCLAAAKVSFIRAAMCPKSKSNKYVINLLHSIFSSITKFDLPIAIGLLTVLGYGVFSFEDTLQCIDEKKYTHISFAPETTSYIGTILVPPQPFILTKEEAKKLASFLSKSKIFGETNLAESVAIAVSYMFLIFAMESQENYDVFRDTTIMNTLHEIAMHQFKQPLQLLSKSTQRISDCLHRLIQVENKIPKFTFSPEKPMFFINVRDGAVKEEELMPDPYETCLFLGDTVIGEHSQCYYEVSIKNSGGFIYMGFLEADVKGFQFYGYDPVLRQILTPDYRNKHSITNKDPVTIGLLYCANDISILIQGQKIFSIPNRHVVGPVIPAIATNNASGIIKYSFGYSSKFEKLPLGENFDPINIKIPETEGHIKCKYEKNPYLEELYFKQKPKQPEFPKTIMGSRVFIPNCSSTGLITGYSRQFAIVELSTAGRPTILARDDELVSIDDTLTDPHLRSCAHFEYANRMLRTSIAHLCVVVSRLLSIARPFDLQPAWVMPCFTLIPYKQKQKFHFIEKQEKRPIISLSSAKNAIASILQSSSFTKLLIQFLCKQIDNRVQTIADIYYSLPHGCFITCHTVRRIRVHVNSPPNTAAIIPITLGHLSEPPIVDILTAKSYNFSSKRKALQAGIIPIAMHLGDYQLPFLVIHCLQCIVSSTKGTSWFNSVITEMIPIAKANNYILKIMLPYLLWEIFVAYKGSHELFSIYNSPSKRRAHQVIHLLWSSLNMENKIREMIEKGEIEKAIEYRESNFKENPLLLKFLSSIIHAEDSWPIPSITYSYSLSLINPPVTTKETLTIHKSKEFSINDWDSIIIQLEKSSQPVQLNDELKIVSLEPLVPQITSPNFSVSSNEDFVLSVTKIKLGKPGDIEALKKCKLQLFNDQNTALLISQAEIFEGRFSRFSQASSRLKDKETQIFNYIMASTVNKHRIHVGLDRFKAMKFKEGVVGGVPLLFQFAKSKGHQRHLSRLCQTQWKCKFKGEGSIDAGGPGREALTEMCEEMFDPKTNLFQGLDLVVPKLGADPLILQTCGALFAAAICWKQPQPFKFSNCMIKSILNKSYTIEDVKEWDSSISEDLESNFFIYTNIHGKKSELIPGGFFISVTNENKNYFLSCLLDAKKKEIDKQMIPFKRGFLYVIPDNALASFTVSDLHSLSYKNDITVNALRNACEVNGNGALFWSVMEEFTAEERSKFLKFVTGRVSLPATGGRFFTVKIEGDSNKLPYAKTCSQNVIIPKYTSKEIASRMIRAAINYCSLINDGDHSVHYDML